MTQRLKKAPKLPEPKEGLIRTGDLVTVIGQQERVIVIGLYGRREFHCQWTESGRMTIEPLSHLRQIVEDGRVLTHRDLA